MTEAASRRTPRWLMRGAIALGAIAILVVVASLISGPAHAATFRYVIPAGTGARLDAGEAVEILPGELDAHVGDRIVLVNDDDRVHVAGPFSVRPGEVLDHRFTEATTLSGTCSLHPSGAVTIVVSARTWYGRLFANVHWGRREQVKPFTVSKVASDQSLSLWLNPPTVGSSEAHLVVSPLDGGLERPSAIELSITRPDGSTHEVPTEPAGAGHAVALGIDLPAAGTYTFRVVARSEHGVMASWDVPVPVT